MLIPEPRQPGVLIQRYKRFLADIRLAGGEVLTVHCPNSGSMMGCSTPGSPVIISQSDNLKRKYQWTLEMIRENGTWIGVNTSLTNRLVQEGIENKIIDEFGSIDSIQREIKVSPESRLDFLLQAGGKNVYIEVKNCSLVDKNTAMFPDAVTKRGTKHLNELERLHAEGYKTAVIFCVQRMDAENFLPAEAIDPEYARTLYRAYKNGVHVLVYQAEVTPESVRIVRKIPFLQTKQLA